VTRCANCDAEVPADEPGVEREPCPNCGSLRRTHEARASLTVGVDISTKASVERAVNEARMTAFALIFATAIGVGLAVGLATSFGYGFLAGLASAAATALLLAAVYRVDSVRQLVMELMHRITGH
jgi:hypothetical protein